MTFQSQWFSDEVRGCSAPISLGIWTAERWTDVGPALLSGALELAHAKPKSAFAHISHAFSLFIALWE